LGVNIHHSKIIQCFKGLDEIVLDVVDRSFDLDAGRGKYGLAGIASTHVILVCAGKTPSGTITGWEGARTYCLVDIKLHLVSGIFELRFIAPQHVCV
jgi:hypothetical protein